MLKNNQYSLKTLGIDFGGELTFEDFFIYMLCKDV